jgi:hypothetical protein
MASIERARTSTEPGNQEALHVIENSQDIRFAPMAPMAAMARKTRRSR